MKDMPRVAKCEALECFYNGEHHCHAPAINVGEHPHVLGHHHVGEHEAHGEHHAEPHMPGHHHHCVTYEAEPQHIARQEDGMVGACHASDCRWNEELLCTAPSITIAHASPDVDCMTYEPRAAA